MSETREARLERIIADMRSDSARYKSHPLGYEDSVSVSAVEEWADELEALSTPPEATPEPPTPEPRKRRSACENGDCRDHYGDEEAC